MIKNTSANAPSGGRVATRSIHPHMLASHSPCRATPVPATAFSLADNKTRIPQFTGATRCRGPRLLSGPHTLTQTYLQGVYGCSAVRRCCILATPLLWGPGERV